MATPKTTKRETELLKFMDRVPPCLVRNMGVIYVLRDGVRRGRLKPIRMIVEDSGLPRRTVQRLSNLDSWKNVTVGIADKFLKGCGVDVLHRDDMRRFIANYADNDFQHLTECERARLYKIMKWK